MKVTLLYFAWVREKVGHAREDVELPGGIENVAGLIAWLRTRGPEYDNAFASPGVIRSAINQTHVKQSAPLTGAREIAFFPPVTGG